MSTRQVQIFKVLEENPELAERSSNAELYALLPKVPKSSIRFNKKLFKERLKRKNEELQLFIENNQKFIQPPTQNAYKWQIDAFNKIMEHFATKLLVPRDHGKSYLICWLIEYLLDLKATSVLLLGWTDRRKDIAEWVYSYCIRKDLIESVRSEFWFTLKNGSKFRCFLTSEKAILGFHGDEKGMVLIIDDPIDDSWRTEPWREAKLERRYKSTISNINPLKILISGTRKCEGDFFDFIDDTYGNSDYDYYDYTRKPYYEENGSKKLLCPERWTLAKLEKKRVEIGEYWYAAEWMQDPHPIEAGILTKPTFDIHAGKSAYSHCAISVDSATTIKKTSDFTAIITILKKRNTLEYFVLRALVDHLDFEEILKSIEKAYRYVLEKFIDINIIVPIEKNAGGNYLIQSSKRRGYTFSSHIIPVHSSKAKFIRIESALEVPLREATLIFSEGLKNTELITEILTFPNSRKLDAIDGLAIGIKELENKHSAYTFDILKANAF